ncbi:unnamed protein product [Heligmosomoides polygyrus]|uniref:Uncharacterized protein n=1 Tax=Heligmosomoides polygyrus TaxID=6339 RepID=A0A183G567_HELPZ|nr:unnamed protein product [Heligmosomoides polygyrus]
MPYMPPPVRWGQPNLAERRSSGSNIAVEEALREDRSEEQPTTSEEDSSATEPEVQLQERDAEEKFVRELTGIVQRLIHGYVGTNVALDVCLRWCRDIQQGMVKTNAQVTRACSAEPTLPKGHSLSSSNLSRNWRSLSTPPFKDMDLNKLMRNWIPNSRIPKNNHYVLCIDFLRFYFAQACNPCEAVKEFACRLSRKGGKSCLLDLPEAITSHLVG